MKFLLTTLSPGPQRFQYVTQQFDSLRNLFSVALIREALRKLPEVLDETYERLFLGIDPKFQAQVASSLKWLAFSNRTLSIEQLAEVFTLHPEEDVGAVAPLESETLFEPQDVLKYLSSLVVVYKNSLFVRLAHFSIKEYLISDRITQGPARYFAS